MEAKCRSRGSAADEIRQRRAWGVEKSNDSQQGHRRVNMQKRQLPEDDYGRPERLGARETAHANKHRRNPRSRNPRTNPVRPDENLSSPRVTQSSASNHRGPQLPERPLMIDESGSHHLDDRARNASPQPQRMHNPKAGPRRRKRLLQSLPQSGVSSRYAFSLSRNYPALPPDIR